MTERVTSECVLRGRIGAERVIGEGNGERPGEGPQAWQVLTPRERQVVAQVESGSTDREIARSLQISPRTVHKHLEQIYRKLGLRSRVSLIVLMHQYSVPLDGS
jgi:DNA-binding CsgD family transcriptional regulator